MGGQHRQAAWSGRGRARCALRAAIAAHMTVSNKSVTSHMLYVPVAAGVSRNLGHPFACLRSCTLFMRTHAHWSRNQTRCWAPFGLNPRGAPQRVCFGHHSGPHECITDLARIGRYMPLHNALLLLPKLTCRAH